MASVNAVIESAALAPAQKLRAESELGRFFQLVDPLDAEQFKMFSGAIDAVWHDLLAQPSAYKDFLEAATIDGAYGHDAGEGFGVIQWVNAYHARFGELDPIWFTNADGALDEKTYDTYLETKTVVVAWNCGVIVPTMD